MTAADSGLPPEGGSHEGKSDEGGSHESEDTTKTAAMRFRTIIFGTGANIRIEILCVLPFSPA
jgi:hypothetical protein